MDSEHVKVSETLHKSARQYFFHLLWSLWKEIGWTRPFLVVSEIFRLFVNCFSCISGIYIQIQILWIKRWTSEVISWWNWRLQKAGSLKCVKSPVSEHIWTCNILKCPKIFLNLHSSSFVIFFNNSERKSAPKNLFWWYLKSWDWLLS